MNDASVRCCERTSPEQATAHTNAGAPTHSPSHRSTGPTRPHHQVAEEHTATHASRARDADAPEGEEDDAAAEQPGTTDGADHLGEINPTDRDRKVVEDLRARLKASGRTKREAVGAVLRETVYRLSNQIVSRSRPLAEIACKVAKLLESK